MLLTDCLVNVNFGLIYTNILISGKNMTWRPHSNWHKAKLKAEVLSNIRTFFAKRNVIEVDTPILSSGTVTDVYLDTFFTDYSMGGYQDHQSKQRLYLQTSPEFGMKRLLASGYGCCYQICKAFRNEQAGSQHNPEFTILEWYRLGFTHLDLMNELSEFLQFILHCKSAYKLTYQNAFKQYLSIDPLTASVSQLKKLLFDNDISGDWISSEQDRDTLLQVAFTECVESHLGQESPCFIYEFPSSQASLAKISVTDERVAERFECYFKGIELANGFHELTDHEEQVQRFEVDNAKRKKLNKEEQPIDERFLAALKHGLPTCSGVALGIDRLLMLALNVDSIKSVLTFSVDDA